MDEHEFEFVMMVKGCNPLVSELINELRNTFETIIRLKLELIVLYGSTTSAELQ